MSQNRYPSLRFPEFQSNWRRFTLGDLTKINQGLQIPIAERFAEKVDDSYFYITNEFLRADNKKLYYIKSPSSSVICNEDDVLMTRTGNTGQVVTGVAGAFHNNFFKINFDRSVINQKFLVHFLRHYHTQHTLLKLAGSSTIPDLNHGDFYRVKINLPEVKEQQKIADFLSSVDKKISLLKERHALLTQYKKGVMQKLFKQEIRFKDDNGNDFPDWQEQRFEQVFERVTRKNKEDNQNVLTISAQRGLINQEKYFNKSVSAKDVTGYYLLEKGDFAYNKSYSKGYPMGAIKRLNNYDKGVVSTLYICFKSHGEQHDEFWEQYFEAGNLNREINKIAQEGARNHGLLNVSVTEFFHDVKVIAPCAEEQQKIADFLQALDKKLDAVNQQIELTQTFKKGLLQQMFV